MYTTNCDINIRVDELIFNKNIDKLDESIKNGKLVYFVSKSFKIGKVTLDNKVFYILSKIGCTSNAYDYAGK